MSRTPAQRTQAFSGSRQVGSTALEGAQWSFQRGADATTRLLATLCDLARRTRLGADSFWLIAPLPHRELASLTELARETASRTLSQWRQRGIVEELEGGCLKSINREAHAVGPDDRALVAGQKKRIVDAKAWPAHGPPLG
jgi:hypothetical protein